MSLCHRGHITKKKKEENTIQCRVLSWTLLRSVPLHPRVNPKPELKTFPCSFSVLLDWKGDASLGHSIMKICKLEGAPHCLLFLNFHPCFSRTCLKTPSHSHPRETAGLQRQKTEQLAMHKGCQLQKEKLRTDTEKHCSSYSFTAIFRQYKENQHTGKESIPCLPFPWMGSCSALTPNTWRVLALPNSMWRACEVISFYTWKQSEFSMREFYNWVHLGACQFREGDRSCFKMCLFAILTPTHTYLIINVGFINRALCMPVSLGRSWVERKWQNIFYSPYHAYKMTIPTVK